MSLLIVLITLAYVLLLLAIFVGYLAGYILILRYANRIADEHRYPREMQLPYVDVIVPVKNEYYLIRDKLYDLVTQLYPVSKINIIVVDSSSDQRIQEYVGRFVREYRSPRITFVKDLQRRGKAHALNMALEESKHEICVVTDVDVRMERDALERLLANFSQKSVGAVSAMETMSQESGTQSRTLAAYREYYNLLRMAESRVDSVLMCESELAAYRRELLEKLDESVQSDDMELTISIRRKGFRAIYDSAVRFYESEGIDWQDTLARKVRRARANIHCLIKNVDVLFNKKLGKFGKIVFPFEFFSNVVSPVLVLFAIALTVLQVSLAEQWFSMLVVTGVFSVAAMIGSSVVRMERDQVGRLALTERAILFLLSFIVYNLVLVYALVLVLIRGSQPNWETGLSARLPSFNRRTFRTIGSRGP